MRIARAMWLALLLILVLFCFGQPAYAWQVLASSHKNPPGGAAAVDEGSGGGQSLALLRPADNGLIKSRPGRRGNHLTGAQVAASLQRRITARTAVVVDADSGRLIYALNPDTPRQPASTIKVITALIALDSLREDTPVPTSRRAARMPRSKVYLQQGRSYRAGDLINALLMRSGNDAAVALAEKIAGSERAFGRLMTSKARALGAKNTTLINANGLTAQGQRSTARDLALIFHRATQHPELARRISTVSTHALGKTMRSSNRALWQIDGSLGGKTGYTRAAQQTYVGKFQRGTDTVVIALMGSTTMWDDVRQLVEYGFDQIDNEALMAGAPVDSAFTRTRTASTAAVSSSLTVLSDAAKSSI
ncbi:MAG: D-alanyl-D-alanine carboxypeptidase family protein [Desulfurivibrio sp.]|nr:D-alanyl-D-alanine carboxypeptidase family protein [Desulfurivibrio sp.]